MLEIGTGTGTGYNAALLAHRLGSGNVVSIEVDPEIAQRARANLAKADRDVRVITADGVAGYPPGAPYDRIIATCSVETVPWPRVAQTRPVACSSRRGGRRWPTTTCCTSRSAPRRGGHHRGLGAFMRLRAQRWNVTDEPDEFPDIAAQSSTDLDPHEVLGNHSTLAVALHLLDELVAWADTANEHRDQGRYSLAGRIWARC